MNKKMVYALALVAVATGGTVARVAAQTPVKPKVFRLDVGLDGKAYCFWDGSDCKVG